jgi:carboxymethylenebutenolidase
MNHRACISFSLLLALMLAPGPAVAADVRDLTYRNGDVEIGAKLYLPAGRGPHPAVLYVHARRGWDAEADAQVRRFVAHGLAVIAPDYHSPRFIPAWPIEHDPATEKDVELAIDALKKIPEVRSDACVVTYYGHMVNPNAPEPVQVYRYAPEIDRISVPVLFIVGEEEQELRRTGIRRAYYALMKRGVPVELLMYPHARRAFDFRQDQREEEKLATVDAAKRASAFIRSVLSP